MPCDIPGCGDTADTYPHGTWCLRHARMMAPRAHWDRLGVPFPEGQEPPKPPVAPVLTRPQRTRLGPIEVIYAPCPTGCGRPTCCLLSEAITPCLACESAARPLGSWARCVICERRYRPATFTGHCYDCRGVPWLAAQLDDYPLPAPPPARPIPSRTPLCVAIGCRSPGTTAAGSQWPASDGWLCDEHKPGAQP